MIETPAEGPVFPPGRYGRRRSTGRRPWALIVIGVAVAAGALAFGWSMYVRYGDPTYDATVIRYTDITDRGVRIDFTVRVPPGGAATCALRARSHDGAEVGRTEVTVPGLPGARDLTASHVVSATARPFIGEVVRCRAA